MPQAACQMSWSRDLNPLKCLLLATLTLAGTLAFDGRVTSAQDEEPAKEAAAAKEAPAAAANDDADAAPKEDGTKKKKESYLSWMAKSLGWSYSIVFLAMSFSLVALVVMNILSIRREQFCPTDLMEGFEANLAEKKYQDAYNLAKQDESFLGKVLSSGLEKLGKGYPQAVEAMQEVGEEENMRLEHRLSYMALIGTVAPMVGLLGTVQGMISSFQVIANSDTTPKPSELAAGVSTALFTTLVGLFIAIPAIGAFNIFKNRVAQLVLEVGIVSESLMSQFDTTGVTKK